MMALPCKRQRLTTDNDVYKAVAVDDAKTSFGEVNVKTEVSMTPATNDVEIQRCLAASEPTAKIIDLTVDPLSAGTRRTFSHTAEVIKARYIRALQQFQRISSLVDNVAAQQAKLEARRHHLQTLMNALSTMYKVVKGQNRSAAAVTCPAAVPAPLSTSPTDDAAVPLPAAESQVTSSTTADSCWSHCNFGKTSSVDDAEDLSVVVDIKPPPPPEEAAVAAGTPAVLPGCGAGVDTGGCCYYVGPTDSTLVAAHSNSNRVDISLTSLDCPPPAHSAKVDITSYTYIVRNFCDAATHV